MAVPRELSAATLQSTLTGHSTGTCADITPHLVKARCYDHLRSHTTGFASGVEWEAPLRANTPSLYSMRDEVDEFRVTLISTRYLDETVYSGTRSIEVGEETWSLDDPTVAVISVDYTTGHINSLWSLQLLMAAPYPLVDLDEFFILTGERGQEHLKLAAMRRNECCTTMNNRVDKFILVHNSGPGEIIFCGQHLLTAQFGRGRERGPAQLYPGRPIFEAAVNTALTCPTPLKEILMPWLRRRCVDENLDWTAVDEIVGWAATRFMPQPEVSCLTPGHIFLIGSALTTFTRRSS